MMAEQPRTETRMMVAFRTYPQSLVWFDQMATEHQLGRSDAIRAALYVARQHPQEMAQALQAIKEMNA
mgnify:CR=1 FL=1